MAITVATQRIPIQIFLQSSIRWVRQSKWESFILQKILPGLFKFENLLIKYALNWLSVESVYIRVFSAHSHLSARVLPLYMLSNLLCIPLIRWGFVNDGSLLFPEVFVFWHKCSNIDLNGRTSYCHCLGLLQADSEFGLNFYFYQHLVPPPAWASPFHNHLVRIIYTLLDANMRLLTHFPRTISTLAFFYLLFPYILSWAKSLRW